MIIFWTTEIISRIHFAYLTQSQVTRQDTVGNMNQDGKTQLFLCEESNHGQLPCCWLALGLAHFGAEFLVGHIGRINVTEILV